MRQSNLYIYANQFPWSDFCPNRRYINFMLKLYSCVITLDISLIIDSTAPKVCHNLVRLFAGFMMIERVEHVRPDGKVHEVIMGPTWVLSAPDGSHVVSMNLDQGGRTLYYFHIKLHTIRHQSTLFSYMLCPNHFDNFGIIRRLQT